MTSDTDTIERRHIPWISQIINIGCALCIAQLVFKIYEKERKKENKKKNVL